MKIWAVCKDPGGTAGMLPVVNELRGRGHEVQLIVNGWAAANVSESAWVVKSDAVSTLIATEGTPDLLLTSTCTTGGTGMWLINWLKGSCPTVALQDIWGGALVTDYWRDSRLHPDHVLVNDRVGEEILLRAWPEIEPEQIHVVGWPAMDRYAGFDVVGTRATVREALGLDSFDPVALFLGGGVTTGGTFSSVVRALNRVPGHFQLIARPHPRMYMDYAVEGAEWDAACSLFHSGRLIVDGPSSIDEAVAASDFVIGDSSTALIASSIMHIPGISVMYPELGARMYREAYRGLIPRFPLTELGCVIEVRDFPSLCRAIELAYSTGHLGLEAAQEMAWSGVGGAAKLAADAIEGIA